MKTLTVISIAVASCALTSMAEPSGKQLTLEERKARGAQIKENMLRKWGGSIDMPGSQKGHIRIVNCQEKVSCEDLKPVLEFFRNQYAFDVQIVKGTAVPVDAAATAMKDKYGADLAIYVIDDKRLGAMLTAPEERWAFVNVAKLEAGAPGPKYTAARSRKAIIRALSYMTAGSQHNAPLVDAMKTPEAYDEIISMGLPVDVMIRMTKYLKAIDITPKYKTTYRAAIERGINIPPTNDYQKAIWDKVHSIPEKLLKITYDKDKQKPVVK